MKRIYRILLSILSGVLLSLAWLGFPGWVLFLGFLPLLYLNRYFSENQQTYRGVMFWGHAWLAFFVWNVLTTWWILNATPLGAALAIITNSFLMSLVWWLAHIARRYMRPNLANIALVVFWISFEYFHYHWDIEWPWLNLGNGFANQIKMVQWFEFTGTLGGTLWVLIMNLLLFQLLTNYLNKTRLRSELVTLSGIVFLIAVPIIISVVIYNSYSETENPKNVVIVQPNINPYSEQYDLKAETEKMNVFLRLAALKTDDETDFVVGPETIFENTSYWNEANFDKSRFVDQLQSFNRRYHKTEMVFGVSSYVEYPDEEHATITARRGKDMIYDVFNAAVFLGREEKSQVYHKSKLVVGVEKMPFKKYLGFMGDLVIDLGGTTNSYGRQKEPTNFTAADGTLIAPVICYESVFGGYVTGYVQKGAQLIFIITNDGWWKNTPGYRQHLSFARLRAIETRRSIARAANTGISCFINQRGDVLQATEWWTEATVQGTVNLNNKITFYVKYGDFIGRISLFVAGLLFLYLISRFFMKDDYLYKK